MNPTFFLRNVDDSERRPLTRGRTVDTPVFLLLFPPAGAVEGTTLLGRSEGRKSQKLSSRGGKGRKEVDGTLPIHFALRLTLVSTHGSGESETGRVEFRLSQLKASVCPIPNIPFRLLYTTNRK